MGENGASKSLGVAVNVNEYLVGGAEPDSAAAVQAYGERSFRSRHERGALHGRVRRTVDRGVDDSRGRAG